jgi:hypothetical protein
MKFNYPLYSIDFGFEKGRPYVFELNDTIGLPSEKMPSHKIFIEKLLLSLKKIATE